jgi:hypothetical protein
MRRPWPTKMPFVDLPLSTNVLIMTIMARRLV